MNVKPAWEACIDGTGINVGVVDLGIDDHEDLPIVSTVFTRNYYTHIVSQRYYIKFYDNTMIKFRL